MEQVKVMLLGMGRMGRQIARRMADEDDLRVVSAVAALGSNEIGKDVGLLAGVGNFNVVVSSADDIEDVLKKSKPDVAVDFTSAGACVKNAAVVARHGVDLVVGTTGFSEQQMSELTDVVKSSKIGAVVSPNMSVGVNVYWHVLRQAAKMLKGYDVEIVEAHHRFKKDAPSGTALKTAEVIAEALGRDLRECGVYGRKGDCLRGEGDIGIHAVRAGDIVGEHTVYFGTVGEHLEFKHVAHSRDAFVNGVLKAVRFVRGKEGFYGMDDVLGLK
ncbi:MAG: 4-hydroxy-tetrahydrodipicolinate reductase [Candidatus Altiarchaeota archaeon]|nr:4-hydroxy-tetrahydrodipicolinate reductase [Candidatus Altiarchaeota archaeon]